jgi:hypothetical protein
MPFSRSGVDAISDDGGGGGGGDGGAARVGPSVVVGKGWRGWVKVTVEKAFVGWED